MENRYDRIDTESWVVMAENISVKKYYAPEIYQDKALLERLGYGILDVESSSGLGSEDVHKYTYLVNPEQSPHFYRNLLYEITGRYYPDALARLLWQDLVASKLQNEGATGQKIDLKQVADQYFSGPAHQLIHHWCFETTQPLPTRLNNYPEARLTFASSLIRHLLPGLRPMIEAGFNFGEIVRAAYRQRQAFSHYFTNLNNKYFAAVLAYLTGHRWSGYQETEKYWLEILENKQRLSERLGKPVSERQATLDYFQRLNLLERVELGESI
jgi:hypothetical protein